MENILQIFRGISTPKLLSMGGVALVLMIGFLLLSFKVASPSLGLLYSNLDSQDLKHITQTLNKNGTHYEIRNSGKEIYVPSKQVKSLRILMAEEGLPSGHGYLGYEIFDRGESLSTSNFMHNVNFVRALEGELGRTIRAFDNIDNARVHLVLPKRELFSRSKLEPRASVILEINNNQTLGRSKINAIAHLVTTAVPDLETHNITIVDTNGRPFKLGAQDGEDPAVFANNSAEYQTLFEHRLKQTIESILERSVGIGKIHAQVSAEIDFDRVVVNEESYDPDGQVARSIQTIEETEERNASQASTDLSVANNLPNEQAPSSNQSGNKTARLNETTNFEISKTTTNHIKESGTVKRLSIAVLVDGIYELNAAKDGYDYLPRGEEEISKLTSLVKSSVGYDETRGDVVEVINMRFTETNLTVPENGKISWIKQELHKVLQTLIIGVVVVLVILLVIKPMVGKAFEFSHEEDNLEELKHSITLAEGEDAIIGDDYEYEEEDDDDQVDIDRVGGRMKSMSIKSINQAVEDYPDETMSVLRSWIAGQNAE